MTSQGSFVPCSYFENLTVPDFSHDRLEMTVEKRDNEITVHIHVKKTRKENLFQNYLFKLKRLRLLNQTKTSRLRQIVIIIIQRIIFQQIQTVF